MDGGDREEEENSTAWKNSTVGLKGEESERERRVNNRRVATKMRPA